MVSIVEREAEEAYPVQYWDGSDIKKTFEPYDGLAEWLRDADSERIDCWHCLSWLANRRRSAIEFLSDEEKKRLASRLGFERIAGQER